MVNNLEIRINNMEPFSPEDLIKLLDEAVSDEAYITVGSEDSIIIHGC